MVGLWGSLPFRTVLNPRLSQIVFDECHKAKNASSTKMGKAVLDLQNKLPLARVVYASATGEDTQGRELPGPSPPLAMPGLQPGSCQALGGTSQPVLKHQPPSEGLSSAHWLWALSQDPQQLLPPPGASEPRNMIYMSRLGIWGEGTPFRTFEEFLHAIEKRYALHPAPPHPWWERGPQRALLVTLGGLVTGVTTLYPCPHSSGNQRDL